MKQTQQLSKNFFEVSNLVCNCFYCVNGKQFDGKTYHKCDTCYVIFSNLLSITTHSCEKNEERIFCGDCGEFFANFKDLSYHQEVHEEEKQKLLPKRSKGRKRSLDTTSKEWRMVRPDDHKLEQINPNVQYLGLSIKCNCMYCLEKKQFNGKIYHKCYTCSKIFSNLITMANHLEEHCEEILFCKWANCGDRFSNIDKINDHMKLHLFCGPMVKQELTPEMQQIESNIEEPIQNDDNDEPVKWKTEFDTNEPPITYIITGVPENAPEFLDENLLNQIKNEIALNGPQHFYTITEVGNSNEYKIYPIYEQQNKNLNFLKEGKLTSYLPSDVEVYGTPEN